MASRKQALRRHLRALRDGLAPAAQRSASEAICARVLDHWPRLRAALDLDPRLVALYQPLKSEVDPTVLFEQFPDAAFPIVQPEGHLHFSRPGPAGWGKNRFGICEPLGGEPVHPVALFVPLLGFDRTGTRLGYGGGYYDRTFAPRPGEIGPVGIGLAYAEQEVAELPCEPHDWKLDFIVTEREWISSPARGSVTL